MRVHGKIEFYQLWNRHSSVIPFRAEVDHKVWEMTNWIFLNYSSGRKDELFMVMSLIGFTPSFDGVDHEKHHRSSKSVYFWRFFKPETVLADARGDFKN